MKIQGAAQDIINYECRQISVVKEAEKIKLNSDISQKDEPSASLSISDEGFMKYRDNMQVNSWEMKVAERERKIPVMDGFDEHYRMICAYEKGSIDYVKKQNGTYSIEDLAKISMEAYASAYHDIKQGYRDGTREIWVCNGDGTMHKRTEEEDLQLLDQAHEYNMKFLDALVRGLEDKEWVNEHGVSKGAGVSRTLTKDFHKALMDSMKKAQEEFVAQFSYQDTKEKNVKRAGSILADIFRMNPEIWLRLQELSKYIVPMT